MDFLCEIQYSRICAISLSFPRNLLIMQLMQFCYKETYNKGTEVIMEKYFSDDKPFFGLVESCFNGKTYYEIFSELSMYLDDLEKHLLLWFNVDMKK